MERLVVKYQETYREGFPCKSQQGHQLDNDHTTQGCYRNRDRVPRTTRRSPGRQPADGTPHDRKEGIKQGHQHDSKPCKVGLSRHGHGGTHEEVRLHVRDREGRSSR